MQYAHMVGFDDIRFASASGSLQSAFGRPIELDSCLPGASCLIVLFKAYRPGKIVQAGHMPLSAYYPASHFAYHAARELTAYISDRGASAVHIPSLPARTAALRTGGFIADNGFYYHPRLGSLVCIQTILTDACASVEYRKDESACLHCGACARACPSGGVGHLSDCLRYYLNKTVPEPLRGDVYQLFGCEKCQTACPLNHFAPGEISAFSLTDLLSGRALPELRRLTGPNMARPMRVKSQAALYAAATGQYQLAPLLSELTKCGVDFAATHAAWALVQLQNGVFL